MDSKKVNFLIVMASIIAADIIGRKFFDNTGVSKCICYFIFMIVLFGISKLIEKNKKNK